MSGTSARPTAVRPGIGWLVPALGLGITGMVLVVVGTFLPWVSSGGRTYRSYAVAGLIDRLRLVENGLVGSLLAIWPFVGPLCLIPILLAALRRRRAAGTTAIVIGLVVATAAAVVLGYAGGLHVPGVAVVSTGPWTVIAGGLTMSAGGILALLVGPYPAPDGRGSAAPGGSVRPGPPSGTVTSPTAPVINSRPNGTEHGS